MPTTGTDTPLSAQDPIRLLAKSFKAILLASIIGAGAGLLASQIVHPHWTAKMAIQLGQVSVPDVKGSFTTQPLESQLTAIERYNLPSFRLQVLGSMGLPAPDTGSKDSDLVFQSLKAVPGRSPNVINVEVSAYSQESATLALKTALETFSTAHKKLFDQAVGDMRGNLAIAETKLAAAQLDYAHTHEVLRSEVAPRKTASNSARDVLASNTASLINSQILALQQQVASYRDALAPLRTYPTVAMGPAYAPPRPSTPGVATFIAIGAAIGLMFGAGLVLLSQR